MAPAPRKRVLVVDDETDICDFVALVLEDRGFEVEKAGDGVEALESISRRSPDLVVLDLMMPRMDGWTVLRRLASRLGAPPVVILSAYADCPRALSEGARGCLPKPFLPGELVGTCQRALAA